MSPATDVSFAMGMPCSGSAAVFHLVPAAASGASPIVFAHENDCAVNEAQADTKEEAVDVKEGEGDTGFSG